MSASSRKRGHSANGSSKTKASKAHHHNSNKQSKNTAVHQQQQQHQQSNKSRAPVRVPCEVQSERGLLEAIGRLLTLFVKGFAALVLFALIFNLALVLLNTLVFKGKISQYIPAKSWRDIIGH